MTLNGQIVVHTKEQILYWFEQADYQDCRINAYPAFLSKTEERDYDNGINLNLYSPNILFIDLDSKNFDSNTSLQRMLKRILKNIASLLYDVEPLVLWSGHGYHIIIPVNAKEALENFTEFMEYTMEPSEEFLQFAERFLSLKKADTANTNGTLVIVTSMVLVIVTSMYSFNNFLLAAKGTKYFQRLTVNLKEN